MSIRYITFDSDADQFEVRDLLDRFCKPTNDPVLAEWVMVGQRGGEFVEFPACQVPIYTVH